LNTENYDSQLHSSLGGVEPVFMDIKEGWVCRFEMMLDVIKFIYSFLFMKVYAKKMHRMMQ